MKYFIAILIVSLFIIIYVILYRLNSKIKIDCENNSCEGCNFIDCIHRHEEEK